MPGLQCSIAGVLVPCSAEVICKQELADISTIKLSLLAFHKLESGKYHSLPPILKFVCIVLEPRPVLKDWETWTLSILKKTPFTWSACCHSCLCSKLYWILFNKNYLNCFSNFLNSDVNFSCALLTVFPHWYSDNEKNNTSNWVLDIWESQQYLPRTQGEPLDSSEWNKKKKTKGGDRNDWQFCGNSLFPITSHGITKPNSIWNGKKNTKRSMCCSLHEVPFFI